MFDKEIQFCNTFWRENLFWWFLGSRESISRHRGGWKGRIEGIVSGGGEDINPPSPLPSPSVIQHPRSSNISKFPCIYASGCWKLGKDCIRWNSCWGAVEHVLERLWGPVKPPLDTHQQITIYSVSENRKKRTIKKRPCEMCKYIKKRILSLCHENPDLCTWSWHFTKEKEEDDQICVHCQCCEANFEMASWRWDNLGFSRMCLIRIAFCASLSSCFLSAHHCWANFKISGTRFHNWSFPHKFPQWWHRWS